MSVERTNNKGARVPFLGFVSDETSLATLRQFAASQGWGASAVHAGTIATASTFLKNHPSPDTLMVEVADVAGAPAAFDALADVCDPGVRVIVTGSINEFTFYSWLMELGISSYLLKPFTPEALENAWRKATTGGGAQAAPRAPGKLIAVVGSRGGAGATTVAANIAYILGHERKKSTAFLDLDLQGGIGALAFDIEPARGLREALEKPDRIDSLFLERVMVKLEKQFGVLSAEEPLETNIHYHDGTADTLLASVRQNYSYVIADVPRALTPLARGTLQRADQVLLITELELAALRDTLRMLDFLKDVLKAKPPVLVANRVGLSKHFEMAKGDFEKGAGIKVAAQIPFVAEAYGAIASGKMLSAVAKGPASAAIHAIIGHFAPAVGAAEDKSKPKILSFLKGNK